MKFLTLRAQCAEDTFQTQPRICDANFSNNISISSFSINLKDKSFIVLQIEVYFQVYIPPWLRNIFRFTVLRLLENAFVKLPQA